MGLKNGRNVTERHPLKDKTNNYCEGNAMSKTSNTTQRVSLRQKNRKSSNCEGNAMSKTTNTTQRVPLRQKNRKSSNCEGNAMSKTTNTTQRVSLRQKNRKSSNSICDCHSPNLTNQKESLQLKVHNKGISLINSVENQTKLSKNNTKNKEAKITQKSNSEVKQTSQEKERFENIENSKYPIVILTRNSPNKELSAGGFKKNDKFKKTLKKSLISKTTITQKQAQSDILQENSINDKNNKKGRFPVYIQKSNSEVKQASEDKQKFTNIETPKLPNTAITEMKVQCDSSDTSLNLKQRILRKRKTKNYADIFRDSSINENNNSKSHVPVYLKKVTDESQKKQKDPFEFTCESPTKPVKKKKAKVVKQKILPIGSKKGTKKPEDWLSDSDSSFHVISKAVKKNSKKTVKPSNKTITSKEPLESVEPITNIPVPVIDQRKTLENKYKVNFYTNQVVKKIMDCSLRESNRKCVEIINLSEDDHYFGFDDCDDWRDDLSHILPSTSDVTRVNAASAKELTKDRFTLLTSTPTQNLKVNSPNPKINIISNVILSPSRINRTPKHNTPKTPSKANNSPNFLGFDNNISLLSKKLRTSETNSPWRNDDLSVRRNPHFLNMKNTSLPCYNQDLILDPKLLELPECAKILRPETEEKKLKQTDILDYFNDRSNVAESPDKVDASRSLFDMEDFSPIKNKNKHSENNTSKVLKKRELNFDNEISPLKARENLPLSSKSINVDRGIDDYFGFNDSDNKENRSSSRLQKKSVEGPMRVPAEEIKKAKEVIQNKCLEIFVEKEKELEKTIEAIVNAEVTVEEAPCVGLFEDLQELSTRKYVRKRPRRVRIASLEVEEEPVENDKPKKKRLDGPSKAEEAELNKWAAQFNALCDEIQIHELETI